LVLVENASMKVSKKGKKLAIVWSV
jgi:hypothetical protein